ncbi:MAG: hypothetical protein RSA27_05385, partial [Oscillospiraceae bacterium]
MFDDDLLKKIQSEAAKEFYAQQENNSGEIDSFMGQFGYKPKAVNEETQGNGFLGWLKDGFDSGAAGVVGGNAHFVDTFTPFGGDTAKYFDNIAEQNARNKEYSAKDIIPFASDYYTNPQGVTYDLGNLLGSATALAAETAAVSYVAGALGVGSLTSMAGVLATRASASGMPQLANLLKSKYG